MPARGVPPNKRFFALAMYSLAQLARSRRKGVLPEMKATAMATSARILDRLGAASNPDDDDDTMAMRIGTLRCFSRDDDVMAIYNLALCGRLNIGPASTGALILALTSSDRVKQAVKILEHHTRLSCFEPPDRKTYQAFLELLMLRSSSINPRRRFSAFVKGMKFKPKDTVLMDCSLGLALALMLQVRENVNSWVDLIFDTIRNGRFGNIISGWRQLLSALLSHNTQRHQSSLAEILTGLAILKEIASGTVEGVTKNRLDTIWGIFFRHAAKSRRFAAEQQRQCIDRAIELYPQEYSPMDVDTHMRIVTWCLSQRGSTDRTDEQGASEAMYRWREMRQKHSPLPPSTWSKMLYALSRSNRLDHAQAVVADAWNQQAVVDSSFWETAEALRLTEQVGIKAGEWRRTTTVSTAFEEEVLDLEQNDLEEDDLETSMGRDTEVDDDSEADGGYDEDQDELIDDIS